MTRDDVAPMIKLADRISREGACAQARDIRALSARRIALIHAHRIPSAFRDPLSSGVNALLAQTPPCLPDVPASTSQTTPSSTIVTPELGRKHEHKQKQKHEHHGHGDGGEGGGD